MANFNSNELVIVSASEGVLSAIDLMASNLASHPEAPDFVKNTEARLTDPNESLDLISDAIENWYYLVFGDSSSAVDPPTPASDTASIFLDKKDGLYTLRMYYDTKWNSSENHVIDFCEQLPLGNYGIVLFDANEYDGYEKVHVLKGHLSESDPKWRWIRSTITRQELWEQRRNARSLKPDIDNPELLEAYKMALKSWSGYGGYEISPDYDNMTTQDIEKLSLSDRGIPWYETPARDIPLLEEYVFKNIQTLPLKARMIDRTPRGSFKNYLLDLVPGDLVTFKLLPDSDLRERRICLLNQKGETNPQWYRIKIDDFSNDQLGFLCNVFPYLEAHVVDVSSHQGYLGVELSIDLRFDFATLDIEGLVERVWRISKDYWAKWPDKGNKTISNEEMK